ncbi:MAG: hypothetical protein JW745_00960 [Sedimentisphaerales bacterium]|nr:hypothetical protein [Sedimentisphaerales bacterium]MBN2842621.1 hypothetical protein [Sedimentisphaerales bacterium]
MHEYIIEPLKRIFSSKSFTGCVLFLFICAVGLQSAVKMLGVHLTKKPIELQQVLDNLDDSKFWPYRVIDKSRIANEEVEAALGTEDYIQWWFEDEREPLSSPFRRILLFVTYYTGDEYTVPHTPEVCGAGSGSMPVVTGVYPIKVYGVNATENKIPMKVLELRDPTRPGALTKVAYFFSANGDYLYDRNQVRLRMNSLGDKYAYFAKIEFTVPGKGEITDEVMCEKVEKLARLVLPELVEDFFPKWPPQEDGQTEDQDK